MGKRWSSGGDDGGMPGMMTGSEQRESREGLLGRLLTEGEKPGRPGLSFSFSFRFCLEVSREFNSLLPLSFLALSNA